MCPENRSKVSSDTGRKRPFPAPLAVAPRRLRARLQAGPASLFVIDDRVLSAAAHEQGAAKAKPMAAPGLRVGFTVGRALGGAVQRNRMKRRLREAVRLTRPSNATSADVVINPKKVLLDHWLRRSPERSPPGFRSNRPKAGRQVRPRRLPLSRKGSRKPKAGSLMPNPIQRVTLYLLRAYKWAISPMFPPACRYCLASTQSLNEVRQAFAVIDQKLAGKSDQKIAAVEKRGAGSRKPEA